MIQTSSRDVSFVLKYAEDYLKESGIISARNEAEVLLMYLLGVKRFRFYDFQGLEDTIFTKYKNLLNERARRVPLQYITGISSFMGIEFITERGVFIPRPETEVLVERVIELFKDKETVYGLDIGTGTANIAISLTKFLSNCRILAIENSKRALGIARINAEKNNLTEKINFREIDILNNIYQLVDEKFDLVISNPPYIESARIAELEPEIQYEPFEALDGGSDGLLFYREISKKAKSLLRNNGIIAFEIGFSQAKAVCSILENNNFKIINVIKDLNDIERVIIAKA